MKRALVALLVFACAGCVATRGSISGPVKPWPPDRPQRQPSISLVIEGTVEGEGVLGAAFAKWRDETLRAYRESGYFAEVVAGLQKKDLRGEIEIHSRIDPAYTNAFLTGFTFFLVPLVITQDLTVRTRLYHPDGSEIALENHGAARLWAQLFLLPVTAFTPKLPAVVEGVVYDLNRATLLQARDRLRVN